MDMSLSDEQHRKKPCPSWWLNVHPRSPVSKRCCSHWLQDLPALQQPSAASTDATTVHLLHLT